VVRRWVVLGLYAAAIYTTLPYGPTIGRTVLRSAAGGWLLGSGMGVVALVLGVAIVARLRRRRAPALSYGALALAAAGTILGLAWLRAQHLERVHLPEYAVASWLAWRALDGHRIGRVRAYVGATLIAAALGIGDELLQAITPGRVCDVRDMAANALGGILGTLVLVAVRAGTDVAAADPALHRPGPAVPTGEVGGARSTRV